MLKQSPYQVKKYRQSIAIIVVIICITLALSVGQLLLGMLAPNLVYSEGDRVGQVIKLSKKGLIWKTWEASMGLTQSGAYAEYWDFSIDNEDPQRDELIKKVTESYNTGDIVKVHYIQRLGVIPWRGKTSYRIKNIEAIQDNPLKQFQNSSEDVKRYNEEVRQQNEKIIQELK